MPEVVLSINVSNQDQEKQKAKEFCGRSFPWVLPADNENTRNTRKWPFKNDQFEKLFSHCAYLDFSHTDEVDPTRHPGYWLPTTSNMAEGRPHAMEFAGLDLWLDIHFS